MGDLTTDTLLWYGDAVKLIEQDDKQAKVGGYLVRFRADEKDEDVDLYGDYFTPDTDFGEAKSSPILFEHGFDAKLGKKRIGRGEIKTDDVGVWIEGYLDKRSEYEEAVLQMVEQGKLGWSSGTAAHLVEYEHTKTGNRILSWPLGLDASLTFTPAEYRNKAIPLKSVYMDRAEDGEEPSQVTEDVEQETIKTQTEMEQKQETPQETPEPVVKGFTVADMQEAVKSALAQYQESVQKTVTKTAVAPTFNINTTLDPNITWAKAFRSYCLGDENAMKAWKASNNTDMNIGTDVDGGNTVTDSMYAEIIARRDEMSLASKLGVRRIPGVGTTVDVPIDGEDDGEFVSTAEANAFDRDAPTINQKSFTLTKYTKKIQLSYELLQDTETNILNFLNDFVARGLAKTHNNALITEAGSNGTDFGAFAASAAIAVDEIDAIPFGNNVAHYLDDSGSGAWIMAPATYGAIIVLDAAGNRRYAVNDPGSTFGINTPTLMGFPVHFSNKVAAVGGGNKSVYFGNWNYMGLYESPGLTFLRDPYGAANTGQVNLYFYTRFAYGVLQAEALGYKDHPTA